MFLLVARHEVEVQGSDTHGLGYFSEIVPTLGYVISSDFPW